MLKRKLSLEQTWHKCVDVMWKEMIEVHWKRGMTGERLKEIYFEKHPKMSVPDSDCYFCDYDCQSQPDKDYTGCKYCPGRLVNKRFDCLSASYNYNKKPKAFYRKLLQLNQKRISARKNFN